MSKIKSKKYTGDYYTKLNNKDKSFYITYKNINEITEKDIKKIKFLNWI